MKDSAVKWLWRVLGRKKLLILLLIVIQALSGGTGVLYALLLRKVVDSAVSGDREGFMISAASLAGLMLGQQLLNMFTRYFNELTRSTLENTFKERLFGNLLEKDFSRISAMHSGEWLNRLTNDTVVAANGCVEIVPGLSGMTVRLISAVVMLSVLEPRFACVIVPGGIAIVLLASAFRKAMKRLHKKVQESDGSLRVFLQERIGSMMMIRSFAAADTAAHQAQEKMNAHKSARMRKVRFSNICNVGLGTAMSGMYVAGVCYCAYGILTGTMSYGTLTAVTQLISQVQSPFANITGYLPRFYAMTASAERLMEIESFGSESEDPPLPLEEVISAYRGRIKGFGLKNADFTYYPFTERADDLTKEDQPVVLNNISLEINKGEYVAFTGQSGCGKSTVLKLMMCIYRLDGGERFLRLTDNTAELSAEWHRLFAYVPQGNQLMTGTIRDIVTFADKNAADDDERINEALRIACAEEFVGGLENGVDTLLGERGTGLSEGQMQRIAIARAIFSGSPVLLLDESTSALDEDTERRLLGNLRSMTDKTVVIVTHRPAALSICDRVLRFTEQGITEIKDKR
ncbi:MAG: ABC transporter ATP-binding protein/permease [Ruminococcus sp.]|nr:ABC transporter ATP-binding protein/permease [Ruminococcus sp.]